MKKKQTVFDLSVKTAVSGVKQATSKVQNVFGETEDPSIKVYQRLTPTDFNALVAEFGPEETLEYIRTMEIRLQKGK
jgi:hypothetical protein